MKVSFQDYICEVVFSKYLDNGNTAITLAESGEVIAVATANGESVLNPEVVGIKTWSENEGIKKALMAGNVIEKRLIGVEPTGFVQIEHYLLTDEAFEEMERQKSRAVTRD